MQIRLARPARADRQGTSNTTTRWCTSPATAAATRRRAAPTSSGAQFDLRAARRARRGGGHDADPQGVLESQGRALHHLPGERRRPGSCRPTASRSTRATRSAPAATHAGRFHGRADPVSAVGVVSARQRAQERLPVPEHRQHLAQRRCSSRCPTTGTSRRTSTSPSSPSSTPERGVGPRRRPALPERRPARRARLELSARTTRVFGGSRSRVQLERRAELPADFRLTSTPRTSATRTTSRTSRRARRAPAPPFSSAQRDAHLPRRALARRRRGAAVPDDRLRRCCVADRPYARVPRLAVEQRLRPGARRLVALRLRVRRWSTSSAPGGVRLRCCQRLARGPHAGRVAGFQRPGLFRAPGARLARHPVRARQTPLPGSRRSPSRTLPIASFDTGLMFEREPGSHDQRTLTLEPRVLYLYVPYRNQDQLPVFDTALPDLNPVELFRTNRYVGADRVERCRPGERRASRAACSMRRRQAVPAGDPRADLLLHDPARDAARTRLPLAAATRSDFVAQLALTAFQDWSADIGVQWDPQNQRSERTAAEPAVQAGARRGRQPRLPLPALRPGAGSSRVSCRAARPVARYRDRLRHAGFDQVDGSAAWPIHRSWNVFARDVYSPARPRGAGAFRRLRVPCVLLAGAARRPALRQQLHRHARTPASGCSWNSPALPVSDRRRTLSSARRSGATSRGPYENPAR